MYCFWPDSSMLTEKLPTLSVKPNDSYQEATFYIRVFFFFSFRGPQQHQHFKVLVSIEVFICNKINQNWTNSDWLCNNSINSYTTDILFITFAVANSFFFNATTDWLSLCYQPSATFESWWAINCITQYNKHLQDSQRWVPCIEKKTKGHPNSSG